MRVLAVTNMFPGPLAPGSGTFVEQQVKGLRTIGLDVHVLHLDREKKGMTVYLGLSKRLQAEIKKFQPNVVHAMYGGVMADQVTRTVTDRPTIVTFHGSDLLGEHLSGPVRKLIAGYGVWASYKAARRAHSIVAVSKTLRDVLPHDIDRSKISIIPNGIDLDRFKPLDRNLCRRLLGWDPNIFHVLFPANSGDPVKRPKLAQATMDSFRSMGIRGEMHYLRGVPNKEVPVWLNASNVLLLTSLHEGSPTVVKEGLACDLPVVSVDVGDVTERIQCVDGCYIARPEPEDLAVKLSLVCFGKGMVNGRDKMSEFSLTKTALRLNKLYDHVLQSPTTQRESVSNSESYRP